jgi:transcriptional regulator with XRE-family HTH domain
MARKEAAAYIKTLRERWGLSQDALATVVGVSKRQAQNWEWGNSTPTIENLIRIMECLGGSLDTYIQLLIEGEEGEEVSQLAEHPAAYEEDRLQQEVMQRLERLRSKSPALAQQFADYGRFLDEHIVN